MNARNCENFGTKTTGKTTTAQFISAFQHFNYAAVFAFLSDEIVSALATGFPSFSNDQRELRNVRIYAGNGSVNQTIICMLRITTTRNEFRFDGNSARC